MPNLCSDLEEQGIASFNEFISDEGINGCLSGRIPLAECEPQALTVTPSWLWGGWGTATTAPSPGNGHTWNGQEEGMAGAFGAGSW